MSKQQTSGFRDTIISLAGIFMLLAFSRYASQIVVPFLLALFIAVIAASPVNWLRKRGLSAVPSTGLVLVAVILALVSISLMIGTSLGQFNQALPEYQARLTELTEKFISSLLAKGLDIRDAGLVKAIDPGIAMGFVNTMLAGLADVLSKSVLIVFTTMFLLFDILDFPRKFASTEGSNSEKVLQQIIQIMRRTNDYTVIKAGMSVLTGVLVWFGLKLIGVDFAVLWGVVAFSLNFIPNIGSILAAVPPVLLALIQFGPGRSAVVIALYLTINMIIGNVVEPKIMGKRLGLSTLAVFISLVFWGWLYGPVGMLLSVPLTMIVQSAAMNNPRSRWFGILLGPAPEEGNGK